MGAKTRLQNGLLLAIIVLLGLNLLLPVRYTLKLVKLEPVGEVAAAEPANTNIDGVKIEEKGTQVPWQDRREPVLEEREVSHDKEVEVKKEGPPEMERKIIGYDSHVEVRVEENEAPPGLSHDHSQQNIFYKLSDHKEMNMEEEMVEEKKLRMVNFHDPSQRMAYYKKLRQKLVGGGPNMRSLQDQRSKRRMQLIREMWTDWFEDQSMVKLERLNEYVTEDIAPMAIQSQLSQCTLALGVSQESLQSQHKDLEKASIKLSAFLSALKSLLPDSFSSAYTSPCWLSDRVNGQSNFIAITSRTIGLEGRLNILPNQAAYLARQAFNGPYPQRLYCLPHFFLAGFPKSATTTLADALVKHPHVSSAIVKEAHWWTRAPIISPDANLLRLNVLRYLMHFGLMARHAMEKVNLLSMDGSQSTLWDSNFVFNGHDFCSTPAAISHVLPKAKFIILMREPSERLYSYYLWSCSFKYGNNTEKWPSKVRNDPAGNFHSEVSHAVSDFKLCLQSHSLYECSNRYTFTNGTKVTQYCGQIGFRLVVSIYYIHIAKFLQFFPREQFLFLKMEDISEETVALMKRVTKFLEITPYPPSKIRDLLERKHNRQRATIQPMHEDTKQLLQDFFRPFNRQLADLLNDTRFLWNYS